MSNKKRTSHHVERRESLEIGLQFQSPLPPADELAKYNDIIPGSAQEIIEMAKNHNEANTKHRMSLLKLAFLLSALFFLMTLGASVYFALQDNMYLTTFYGSIPALTLLITVFKKNIKSLSTADIFPLELSIISMLTYSRKHLIFFEVFIL